jgi:hypothetical protein
VRSKHVAVIGFVTMKVECRRIMSFLLCGLQERRGISHRKVTRVINIFDAFPNKSDFVFFYNDARQSDMKTKTDEASSRF